MRILTSIGFALMIAALPACSTTPTLQETLASGSTLMEPNSAEAIGDDGVTHVGADGSFAVYYAPDGRKVLDRKGTTPTELGWRVDEQGRFCEDYFSNQGEETCGAEIKRVVNADGVVTEWPDGKPSIYRYRVERGNPRKL